MSAASSSISANATSAVAYDGDDASSAAPPPSSFFLQNVSNLGLGYAIAISLGFLVLLSTVVLASYVCLRASSNRRASAAAGGRARGGSGLPRIIFVTEGDDDTTDDDEDDDEERGGGRTSGRGLDPAAISSYPKISYSAGGGGGKDGLCSICLGDYGEGEVLRMMPDCKHYFHASCIDAWLRLNASCPVCRTSPLPTPVSTPLSELVPLSQYSADRHRR